MSLIWNIFLSESWFGALVGVLLAGYMQQIFNRKTMLLTTMLISAVFNFMQFAAEPLYLWYLLPIGRFLASAGTGVAQIAVPIFLFEVAPRHNKGSIIFWWKIVDRILVVVAGILGHDKVFGKDNLWDYCYLLLSAISLTGLVPIFLVPETPENLLAIQDDTGACRSLMYYHGSLDELESLRPVKKDAELTDPEFSAKNYGFIQFLSNKSLYPVISAGFIVALCAQRGLSNELGVSSTALFVVMGFENVEAQGISVIVKILGILILLLVQCFVDKMGRRPLFSVSVLIAAVTYGLGGLWFLREMFPHATEIKYFYVVCTSVGFASGYVMNAMYFVIIQELFPYHIRACAKSMTFSFCQFCTGVSLLCFGLTDIMGSYILWFSAVPLVLSVVYLYWKMPETKGKTPEEVLISMGLGDYNG